MPILQCCVGPSTLKAHLRLVNSVSKLTLCEATAPVQDYKGNLAAVKLCQRCGKNAMELLQVDALTAQLIGVREII